MSLADKRSLWAEEVRRTLRVMKQKLLSVNTSKTLLWTPFYLYSYSEQALQVSTSTPCIVLFEKVQNKVCLSARLLIYKYYTCLGCNLHKNHKKMRWPFPRNNKQENKKEHAWRLVTNNLLSNSEVDHLKLEQFWFLKHSNSMEITTVRLIPVINRELNPQL